MEYAVYEQCGTSGKEKEYPGTGLGADTSRRVTLHCSVMDS